MSKEKNPFIPVSLVWFQRFMECSNLQGTPNFPKAVWRFYHSLLNLGDGKKAVKNNVADYVENVWYPNFLNDLRLECERKNVSVDMDYDRMSRDLIYKVLEESEIIHLYEYIIQTIQDSGIGWPTKEQFESYAGDSR